MPVGSSSRPRTSRSRSSTGSRRFLVFLLRQPDCWSPVDLRRITGLTVGRDAILGDSVDNGVGSARACVYASQQVHNSVDKAMGVLGLGRSSLRKVKTLSDF